MLRGGAPRAGPLAANPASHMAPAPVCGDFPSDPANPGAFLTGLHSIRRPPRMGPDTPGREACLTPLTSQVSVLFSGTNDVILIGNG